MKRFYTKVTLHKPLANNPVLRCRGGRFRFIPASGLCPWQTKRLCKMLLMNAIYGKCGSTPSTPDENPREAYYGRRSEEFIRVTDGTMQPVYYYDVSSAYPASMMADMPSKDDGHKRGFTQPFLKVEVEAPR